MIKKGDFIEIDYIAKLKSSNKTFDLTLADVAKKEVIFSESQIYKPFILCVGENHIIKGLDEALEGKEAGKEFEIDIGPEKAFGKRSPKLIQLTSQAIFRKQKMNPFPGLQLNIDGALATVRSVSGGRVILDFNNPLAGQTVHYWVRINREVASPEEQIKALAYTLLAEKDAKVKIKEKQAEISLKIKDKQIINKFKEKVKELTGFELIV